MSTTVQTIQNNNINNNNKYISQLAVLRNVIIDERKKREDLEKKNLKLEEERNLFQKENENLKEGNIMKSELIEKLKIELKNYRDKSSKKQIKNFFTNLFEDEINPEEKQEQEIKEDEINYLKKQIEDLKNNITLLEEEKKIINNNLKEQITEYNKLKIEYEKKILEIEKKYENKILTLEKEIKEKNNILKPILEKNEFFSNYIKNYDLEKINFENEISRIKIRLNEITEEKNNKEKIINEITKDQNNLLNELNELKKEKEDLKMEIEQYKLLIQELTPLNINHDFEGYILPKYEDEKRRRIQINFNKVQKGIYIKVDNKEVVFTKNDIQDFIIDYKFNDRIIIVFNSKENDEILCQFSNKEVKFLKQFFDEFKNKNTEKNNFLKLSFGDYFY